LKEAEASTHEVSFETVNVRCSQQWAKRRRNNLQRNVGMTELEFRFQPGFSP
jgi:hypothetical protein